MGFSALDVAVGTVYFVAVPIVGVLVGRRQKDLGGYFLGGRSIPWWAVWLSILAAEISAATFIGAPAFAYKPGGNWTYVQPVFGTILARIVVAYLFLKPFYDLQVTTVYGYLDRRFGPRTRFGAGVLFLFTRVLASGVRLYGGALVFVTLAGKKAEDAEGLTLVVIGILAAVTCGYTLIGGIKAVVATDSIQLLVMFAGALTAAAVLLYRLGGPSGFLDGLPQERLQVFDLTFDLATTNPTLVGGIVGGAFITMASHGTDQDIVQRLLTAKDVSASRRALIASGILDIPIVVLFLGIGSLLWVYFQRFPHAALPAKPDQVFPFFIMHGLPPGVGGLVVAALLSVIMGSLSAAMNALASTAMLDFWKPYVRPDGTPEQEVRTAKILTLAFGLLLALVAGVAVRLGKDSNLIDLCFRVIGFTYGPLLGTFLRGFLTKGGGDRRNLVAMAAAIAVLIGVDLAPSVLSLGDGIARKPLLHWQWYVPIGAVVTFFVGVALSFLSRGGASALPASGGDPERAPGEATREPPAPEATAPA